MASLLPSLSSDDEEDNVKKNVDGDNENDMSDDDEVNEDFEFGGILGEDGGAGSSDWMGAATRNSSGWSYQSALALLERNDASNVSAAAAAASIPRMDVSSLIEAKRQNIKSKKAGKEEHAEKREKQHVQEEAGEDNDESESSCGRSSETDGTRSNSEGESDSDDNDSNERDSDEGDSNEDGGGVLDLENDKLKMRAGQEEQAEHVTSGSDHDDDEEERAKEAAYFDHSPGPTNQDDVMVFAQLTLSRPLLRGVAAMGFVRPTPIQASVIPVALAGRDVCASAVTGSGKTAAFVLPILERLTQRIGGSGIKGLILTPTRELAAQCLGMMSTLARYTNVRATLIVGGAKNINAQAAELRARPDIVVATPGRLLDHVTNSAGVTLDDVEFLILDEADRLLDLGFQEEVHELIKTCPSERQTMLFSATMTTKVDDLVKLSLKRPVRIKVSDKHKSDAEVEVAPRLEQEFVRVRSGNEGINREGMLLALLTRTFSTKTIVFFDTKAAAHRLMILCGLCGIKCAELHGNLTQMQRLTALEQFRKGNVDILLATDLAARGLDIDRLEAVINFEMPNQVETYVHRIGRSARAGRGGTSCTLIGEGRRHLMKEVIKDAEEKSAAGDGGKASKSGIIRSRTIPPAVVAHFVAKIRSLEPHVQEVIQAEAVARLDRLAEMEAMRAKNIIEHADDIKSRPQREWFASNQQKQSTKMAAAEKQKMIAEKVGTGTHRMTRKKRRAREAKEELMRFQEEMQQEREESGKQPKKKVTDKSIKTSARAHKKQIEQKAREVGQRSIHDEDQEYNARQRDQEKKTKRKGAFASDSAGDSSLFADEKVAFAKKQKSEATRPSSFEFTGYDPNKFHKKKPKKKSVHAFKSKSKYKRRK